MAQVEGAPWACRLQGRGKVGPRASRSGHVHRSQQAREARVVGDLHDAGAPPAGDEPDAARPREVKVLEAADGAVAQVCHVLAGTSPPALLREEGVCHQGAPGVRAVHAPHAVRAPEVAGEARLVGAHARQGAREARGGDLGLEPAAAAVGQEPLGAGLARVGDAVGLPVVEDVGPLSQAQEATVGVSQVVGAISLVGVAGKAHVPY